MLREMKPSQVKLLSGLFRERFEKNREYLVSLKTEALLQNFYLEAGIILPGYQVVEDPAQAAIHWGWESPTCQLRGHFLGHWLSASSRLIASEHDEALRAKLNGIIDELARCQEQNGGKWVASIPEKYFERLAENRQIWSPQYTMHKTLLGLTDAYRFAHNLKALNIISGLADWYLRWTNEMAKRNPHAVYSGEEGGMLEQWELLYELTGDERFRTLADCYKNPSMFQKLQDGKDPLTNCHANASIPLSHGAFQLYKVTGEEKWRHITERFWEEAVTKRGFFATTGQNAGEFWIPPHMQSSYIGSTTQEFCTVYNMVRTASMLYTLNASANYADYVERALYNGFLSQQNRTTALPTYFLPLKPGSRKKWGTQTRDFWCCYGTMVQAQSLYPSLIYYDEQTEDADIQGKNKLYVSQYIPSELSWNTDGVPVHFSQCIAMKSYNSEAFFDAADESQSSRWALKFTVQCSKAVQFTLNLRIPSWVQENPLLSINGKTVPSTELATLTKGSYLTITRSWEHDEILLYLPVSVKAELLPDTSGLFALLEGPIVLAGINTQQTTLHAKSPEEAAKQLKPQYEHTYGTFPWKQSSYHVNAEENFIEFMPLYDITDEAYTVYFHT